MHAKLPELIYAQEDDPPFRVDAVVVEEDTGLVLSADRTIIVKDEHPIRLMMALWEFTPEKPGAIVVKGRNPFRLFAIVHDFDAEPSCKKEWVLASLHAALQQCRKLGVLSLGMQLLGCRYGNIEEEWFIDELEKALWRYKGSQLQKLWLMLPP